MSDPWKPTAEHEDARPPLVHDTDAAALVSGLVFSALGLVFLLDVSEAIDWDLELRWVWPILLIGLGLAGLVANARRPG